MLQLPVPNNPVANIPLAAGYLKAYAYVQGLLELVEIEIMPRALADYAGDALLLDAIVERQPTVLALSLYTWNSERSLTLALQAKQALPDLLVVVGGPEVQRDNRWVLHHQAVDLAVEGEGEQTFTALLWNLVRPREATCRWCSSASQASAQMIILKPDLAAVGAIPGTVHRHQDTLVWGSPRTPLEPLDQIPSPYLLGFLELHPGDMALVECSRWCPYACTFCLYGRNMSTRLGGRMFGTERILAEVAWARSHGAGAIHFVEANLNLLPNFKPLMTGLQQLNQQPQVPVYAELRGEHLKEETVAALVAAGLHTAEVGLQSANPDVLQRVGRRTDLLKWAVGTRRLYEHGVHVLLDVILGLPGEDQRSTLRTIDWIAEQALGDYDIFTLQLLPGTGVRSAAEELGLHFQAYPPYYVLQTDQLSFWELRALRWELREAAGLDPLAVEGMPLPAYWLLPPAIQAIEAYGSPINLLHIDCAVPWSLERWQEQGELLARQVARHVVVHVQQSNLAVLAALCWPIAQANPTIHWDILLDDPTLLAADLRTLAAQWPHQIGYLDRIAVYRQLKPEPAWFQVTPRWWLLLPWHTTLEPLRFEGVATVVWLVAAAEWDAAWPTLQAQGAEYIIVSGALSDAILRTCADMNVHVLNAEGAAPLPATHLKHR